MNQPRVMTRLLPSLSDNIPAGKEEKLHFHDANEYWIVVSGTFTGITEGNTYELGPGDLVLTKKGDEHALIKAKEDVILVYFYGKMPPGGEFGHLHR